MGYHAIIEMASSTELMDRVVAAAAQEGVTDPHTWVNGRKWAFAATPGWDGKWEYAKAAETINHNPATGARDDVIADADILAAVQAAIVP